MQFHDVHKVCWYHEWTHCCENSRLFILELSQGSGISLWAFLDYKQKVWGNVIIHKASLYQINWKLQSEYSFKCLKHIKIYFEVFILKYLGKIFAEFFTGNSQVEFFYNSYKTAYFSNLIKYKFTLWNLKKYFLIFLLLLLFFYFTVLYWFCHTSTCIRHGCTRVPHPEPPSHLPPHTIPLGHLSAPAPSFLYPASNLDWRFVKKKQLIVNFFPILFT